jgi:NADPH2:quinone reductase
MKAVVCEAFGGPEVLALRDVPDPPPPGPGEVQVRIEARGVQYVDVLMLAGKYQFRPEPPFIPGSEAAGVVVSVGAGVTQFRVGDRVMSRHSLGACAERGNAAAALCDRVPANMSMEAAGVFRGAYSTAYHALLQRGRMKAGEWVLVHGAAGGIGTAAIQLAKALGAQVIAVVSTEAKADFATTVGADDAVLADGFRDSVKRLTGGRGVDLVVDPVGGDRFTDSLRCLAPLGRLLVIGFTAGDIPTVKVNRLLLGNIDVRGVGLGAPLPVPHSSGASGTGSCRTWKAAWWCRRSAAFSRWNAPGRQSPSSRSGACLACSCSSLRR